MKMISEMSCKTKLVLITILVLMPTTTAMTAFAETNTSESSYQNGYKAGVYDASHSSSEAVDGTNQTREFRHGWINGYCVVMGDGFGSHAKCLVAATELAASVKHKDFSQTKDCMRDNVIDSYWIADTCHHQQLPMAVGTTSIHCYNETCESTGWTAIISNNNTVAFKKGFMWGAEDAKIYINYPSQCTGFSSTSTVSNQSPPRDTCFQGYNAGYSKIINQHHVYTSALAALHKTITYQTGYKLGHIWNSSQSSSCNFTGRDEQSCYVGWIDARTLGFNFNDPNCSNVEHSKNSCYNIGESDGNDLAEKYIITCNKTSLIEPKLVGHSKSYIEGFHNGVSDTLSAAENGDGTYGSRCLDNK